MNSLQTLLHWYYGIAPWEDQFEERVVREEHTMMSLLSGDKPAYKITETVRRADGKVISRRRVSNV